MKRPRGISRPWVLVAILLVAGAWVAVILWIWFSRYRGAEAGFALSPDGERVVFTGSGRGGSDLYLLDFGSLRVTCLASTPEEERRPAFAPDGRSVIYAAKKRGTHAPAHLFARPVDGGEARQLTADKGYDLDPTFSADGRWIAWARAARHRPYSMGGWTWDHWDLWVARADGSQPRRVTWQEYYQLTRPRFARDGESLFFSADPGSGQTTRVFVVGANGKAPPRTITPCPAKTPYAAAGAQPDVSADGRLLAFLSDRASPYNYDVHTMHPDGEEVTQVTNNRSYNEHPVFTPDGRRIQFLSDLKRNDRPELWEVGTDGRGLRRIADFGLFENPLRWRPQGP